MWEWIRYRALILAVLPFVIGGSLWYLSMNARGWGEVRFLIVLILSMPVLAGLSALSVMFAFRKENGLDKLKPMSKAASIFSLAVSGGLVLIGAAGVIQSLWF